MSTTLRTFLEESAADDDDAMAAALWAQMTAQAVVLSKSQPGSQPGRAANIECGFAHGHLRIMLDYFWSTTEIRSDGSIQYGPVYNEKQFDRRFRMSRSMFNRVFEATTTDNSYLRAGLTPNYAGKLGASRLQKVVAAMRQLAYGCSVDSLDEYCRLGESTALLSLKEFCRLDLRNRHCWGCSYSGRRINRYCSDFRRWMRLPSSTARFSATVELLGNVLLQNKFLSAPGHQLLFVIELQRVARLEELPLPDRAEWKDLTFISACARRIQDREEHKILETALQYIKPISPLKESVSDPRYQRGWFRRAVHFLAKLTGEDSDRAEHHVIHQQLSVTSTLLRLDTSQGGYYLKAPALGCNEASITRQIVKMFPGKAPQVIGISKELNCFVMRNFSHVVPPKDDLIKAVRQLGDMQLQSISHVDDLIAFGCDLRDLPMLEEKIRLWENGEPFPKHRRGTRRIYKKLVPILAEICQRLVQYRIPCTLCHGDFALSNVSSTLDEQGEDMLIFDWQFVYIGHPFTDFYRLKFYDNIPQEMLNSVIEEYLSMWAGYEDIERAWEAFELGWKLGFFMKLWSVTECMSSCDFQLQSSWKYIACNIVCGARDVMLM